LCYIYIKVRVTISSPQNGSTETKETEIRQLTKGEYFGEKALLGEGRRTANVYAVGPGGVEVLCLYRKDFLELIGDIQELKNKEYADEETRLLGHSSFSQESSIVSISTKDTGKLDLTSTKSQDELHTKFGLINQPLLPASLSLQPKIQCNILLKELEHICVLGVGGFGRVDLVTLKNDRTQAFALKRLQKAHIVQTRQQEHVYCEKLILSSVSSPFICRIAIDQSHVGICASYADCFDIARSHNFLKQRWIVTSSGIQFDACLVLFGTH
uniref:Cyclic nucleotide-binding domain-containing protein n=1 Tax=Schistosoma curassoni TaxID=6186 RepID=A0A183K8U3_9TREM